MAVNGRPKKEINWKVFEDLCAIFCTQTEIASVLDIHIDTLRDRVQEKYGDSYSNVYKKYQDPGKVSLRRIQFKLAQKNAPMAIFLGKQYLGQKDNYYEHQLPQELSEQYTALMKQISEYQSARKIAESNSSKV